MINYSLYTVQYYLQYNIICYYTIHYYNNSAVIIILIMYIGAGLFRF